MSGRVAELQPTRHEVCAIVVTYHPDTGFADRINRVLPQVGAAIVIDNGSSEPETRMLRQLALVPSISLTLNPTNLGVAAALNMGVRHARAHGFAWVLLLDQDTVADADMVEQLRAAWRAYPDQEKLAVVGAAFRDINKDGVTTPYDQKQLLWEEVGNVITSGSLLSLSSHAAVGPFREEFFIDHVDLEYCVRARAKGFRIIRTRKPLMLHSIGAYTQHRWLWQRKWTSNHSADRRYYLARNDTVMLAEYGNYRLGLWCLKSLRRCQRVCMRIALYEDSKWAKIAAVAEGWWDGLRGHMGPRRTRRPE